MNEGSAISATTEPPATPAPPIALDLDPFSPEHLADPYRFHVALRDAGPVVHLTKYDCYAMGRYAEVQSAFGDWRRFSSAAGTGLGHIRKGEAWRPPGPIVEADPPDHTRMRSALSRILSPAVVRSWRARFEAEAARLVTQLVAAREFDGVRDLVEPYVLKVFPDALGIDNSGRDNLLAIGDLTTNALGPANALFRESQARVDPIMPWFNAKFERAAMLPGGFGEQIWALGNAGEIDVALVPTLMRTFLRGGTDTVISGLSSALWLLATHPDLWAMLQAEPGLVRGAFDEAIRLETPAQSLFRTTTGRFVFAGCQLEDDVKVLCSLGAANRDPARWPDADRFDVRRSTVGHLALGTGVHVCLGQMIARLEAEAVLTALLQRVDRLDMAGEPLHRPNNTARRLDRLPLRATPKAPH